MPSESQQTPVPTPDDGDDPRPEASIVSSGANMEFFRGGRPSGTSDRSQPTAPDDSIVREINESLSEAMNARHVAFLLGSGCSSLEDGPNGQRGIATMRSLAVEFAGGVEQENANDPIFLTATEKRHLKQEFGIDVTKLPFAENLERLMEVLYSWKFAFESRNDRKNQRLLALAQTAVKRVKRFILMRCTKGAFTNGDERVLELYESFYRKLVYRDSSLPRPWIFTTNYDLFNETAMDRLGLPYSNGFSGSVERRFNPSVFRYALGEQLDVSSKRWTPVDGFAYLCKLHGSVNWLVDHNGFFPVRELQACAPDADAVMIYPTPAKSAASFAIPYSSLLREFQHRIVREQSVLIVIGYGFGDDHINDVIYQALTVPTFRLIAFAPPNAPKPLADFRNLEDPRIWLIGGREASSGRIAHHFDFIIEKLMPELPGNSVDKAIRLIVKEFMSRKTDSDSKE